MMFVKFLLMVFLFKFICGFKEITETKNNLRESQCVHLAVEKYIGGKHILFIFSAESSQDGSSSMKDVYILQRLQEELKWSIAVRNVKDNITETSEIYWSKIDMYLISFKHVYEIEIILKVLEKYLSWNPRATFLIISRNNFKENIKITKKIFNLLLNYNVINVVIMLANQDDSQSFSFLTWNPFENGNCGNSVNFIVLIGSCTVGTFESNTTLYKNESFGHFKNCRATAGTINLGEYDFRLNHPKSYPKFRFLEMKLVDIIAKFSNITISHKEIKISSPGDIYDNGIATGGFQYLKNNTIDILIGGYSLTPLRYIHFEASTPYIFDSIRWCVPNYPVFTKFQRMFDIVRPTVWILIFSIYFLVAILIWWASSHSQEEYSCYISISNIFLYQFTIALSMSLNKLPKVFQVRYLVMIFVIFSFYVNIAYQTYLTSILADDSNIQKYGSQEDIYKYNLKTYFRQNSKRFFAGDKLVLQKYKDCFDFQKCMDFVARRRDSAFCTSRIRVNYVFNNFISKKKGPMIYCFRHDVVSYPISIIIQKGSPLYSHINKAVSILRETGIIGKLKEDSLKPRRKQISDFDVTESRTLKFDNLLPVFLMFVVGHVAAICAFFLELMTSKLFTGYLIKYAY